MEFMKRVWARYAKLFMTKEDNFTWMEPRMHRSLDIGYMQRISDNAITIIADACAGLVQLCIRNCLLVTDEAVNTLAFRGRVKHGSKLLQRLDISKCPGVSVESFEFLKKPLFRG